MAGPSRLRLLRRRPHRPSSCPPPARRPGRRSSHRRRTWRRRRPRLPRSRPPRRRRSSRTSPIRPAASRRSTTRGRRPCTRRGRLAVHVKSSDFYATAVGPRPVRAPTVRVTALNPARTENAGFGIVCGYRDQGTFLALAVGANGTYAVLEAERAACSPSLSGDGEWTPSRPSASGARRYALEATCGDGAADARGQRRPIVSAPRRACRAARSGVFVAGHAEIRFDDLVIQPGGASASARRFPSGRRHGTTRLR